MKTIKIMMCAILAAWSLSAMAQCAGEGGTNNNPFNDVTMCGGSLVGCCTGTCHCTDGKNTCS